jgi:hypothetical protein
MKVLVFVDHDIVCRHFVMNGALAPLVEQADVRFIFPDDGGKRMKLDPVALSLGAPFERLQIDAIRQQTWRWILYADQLRPRRGAHEAAIRRLRWASLGWKAALLLTLAGFAPGSMIFRRLVEARLAARPNHALTALFDRERPNVVLHPTVLDGVFINDLVSECRMRGIPLVVAMNSWDNPSTKRAVVGKPDWLLVWGPQTRDHAVRFIGLDPQRVFPFGAAQFDVFRGPPRIDRATFCAAHGLDPRRRIALFAGSNAQTDEFATLQALDRAVAQGRLKDIAIVYRPHPWGGGGRDGARLAGARFDHVVVDRTMRAYLDKVAAQGYSISLPDYRDTHDLLSAVDVVVSPMSTILLEAALHGKPVVAYTPTGIDRSKQLASNLPMLHFADFLALPEVVRAGTIELLIKAIVMHADPLEGRARGLQLQGAAGRFITPFELPWRDRLVAFLEQVVGAAQRTSGRVAEAMV